MIKVQKNNVTGSTRIKSSGASDTLTPPNPDHFVETYRDGTKLYKINSYIKAVSKYAQEKEQQDK
jgi:hypothetical protein